MMQGAGCRELGAGSWKQGAWSRELGAACGKRGRCSKNPLLGEVGVGLNYQIIAFSLTSVRFN
jgi:hypothetical protein